MNRLRIFPIVEGQGEGGAVPILLRRIWELLGGEYIEIFTPFRCSKQKLLQASEMMRILDLAISRLGTSSFGDDPALIILVLDADNDLPCILGPQILARAKTLRADADVSCVIANVEFETWFVAAAESLARFLDLSGGDAVPRKPEETRQGKGWIQKRFRGDKYTPAFDQPRLTQAMDLTLCRSRSPSFDKLCRELETRLRRA